MNKLLNRANCPASQRCTERIMQIGEGNFLRAFVDWIVSRMNHKVGFDSSIVVVKPRPGGSLETLNNQNGLFHVNLRGLKNGVPTDEIELVDSVSRGLNPYSEYEEYMALAENENISIIISNTTEAGIAFDPACKFEDRVATSYPGKLVQWLFHRYNHFKGQKDKGVIILPCELIADNGKELRKCIDEYIQLWNLPEEFTQWINESCVICPTLVDRIVTGYPKDNAEAVNESIGYNDAMLVSGEPFHLWVIEAPKEVAERFQADKAGMNVKFVKDLKPFHDMKVALLNAPHTLLSPIALLSGIKTVREAVEDDKVGKFVNKVMHQELMPTVDLDKHELESFANEVIMRFRNPFIRHELESIMLNAFSKYKARVLPSLKVQVEKTGKAPKGMALGLAALILSYRGVDENGNPIKLSDQPEVMEVLQEAWKAQTPEEIVHKVLSSEVLWGEDLTKIPTLEEEVTSAVESILKDGIQATVAEYLTEE